MQPGRLRKPCPAPSPPPAVTAPNFPYPTPPQPCLADHHCGRVHRPHHARPPLERRTAPGTHPEGGFARLCSRLHGGSRRAAAMHGSVRCLHAYITTVRCCPCCPRPAGHRGQGEPGDPEREHHPGIHLLPGAPRLPGHIRPATCLPTWERVEAQSPATLVLQGAGALSPPPLPALLGQCCLPLARPAVPHERPPCCIHLTCAVPTHPHPQPHPRTFSVPTPSWRA